MIKKKIELVNIPQYRHSLEHWWNTWKYWFTAICKHDL